MNKIDTFNKFVYLHANLDSNIVRYNRKNIVTALLFIILLPNIILSQEIFVPLNNDVSIRYEESLYKQKNFHSAVKPYNYNEIKGLKSIDSALFIDKNGEFSNYILNKNLLGHSSNKFKYSVNPIINTLAGVSINEKSNISHTSIGASVSTNLGNKLYAQYNYQYNQSIFPQYLSNRIDTTKVAPHFTDGISKDGNVYAYNSFTGFLSYSPSNMINFQFGRDKNFWGDGYRSFFLSDNSAPLTFLKASVNVWKFKYIMLFSGMKDVNSDHPETGFEEKYSSAHFLSWNVTKRLNVNLFEAVVWRGEDTLGYRGYDVNYLNPIIFYRPVEFYVGSPDNMLMGLGFKYRIGENYNFYGQFVIDEFKLDHIKAKDGWMHNKYSIQLGLKSYKFLWIENLFFMAECNYVRPFMYSHRNSLENYGSYYQSLTHPIGSNFKEVVTVLRYSHKRLAVKAKLLASEYGSDADAVNYGQNMYRSYNDNSIEFGNVVGQGLNNKLLFGEFKVQYLLNPKNNINIEAGVQARYHNVDGNVSKNMYVVFGIKTNLYNYDLENYY